MQGKKVKNQILLNIYVLIAAVIFCAVLILGNVGRVAANVAVVPGSYGETYALKNKLNVVALSDSEKGYFDQRYESFDYNTSGNGITLEKYSGNSTDLVIPAYIGDKAVIALSEGFIESLTSVKRLYVPNTVSEIGGDPDESIIVCCYKDSELYKEYMKSQEKEDASDESTESSEVSSDDLEKSEDTSKQWNIEVLYDSDFVNFYLGDIPFEYNLKGSNVEITRYIGNESMVIIPSHVDGYPVTNIAMNLFGKSDLIVIPDTVIEISGTSAKLLYSPLFAIELIFSVIAIVLTLLSVNMLLPRYRKSTSEYLLTGSQIVASVLYVICQLGFAIAAIYYLEISAFLALVISLVILAIYVLMMFSAGIGREHAADVSKRMVEKTSRMDSIKESVKGIDDSISDSEVKKQVRRLAEEIRYSDPVTNKELDNIESDIEFKLECLKKLIKKGDNSEIISLCDEIMTLVKDRNKRCKAGK